MSGKAIATIYFYLVSAASLALIVMGIFNAVNLMINSTQYEKYPLRYEPGIDCESGFGYPVPYKIMPPDVREEATISAQDLEKQTKNCLRQQELERRQHKVDDFKDAITFSLVGVVLFSIHFPLARKQSRD
ncbi:hypothetical protein HY384_00895 [Candidatus Daviesbacteria bacterium]|nr:hypothetical protein [Candidatus Daviesbacteria bacterium]